MDATPRLLSTSNNVEARSPRKGRASSWLPWIAQRDAIATSVISRSWAERQEGRVAHAVRDGGGGRTGVGRRVLRDVVVSVVRDEEVATRVEWSWPALMVTCALADMCRSSRLGT